MTATDGQPDVTAAGGAGTVVGWAFSQQRTQALAQKTQELLRNREVAAHIAEQTRNALPGHAEGRVFELIETVRFNLAAIDAGSQTRAVTTAALGQGAAPADILVRGARGETVREVQAKVYDRTSRGLRALAEPKYRGMGRLVPADQSDGMAALADRVATGPAERLNRSEYRDVADNLMGSLEHDGVSSPGATRAELRDIGNRPDAWLEEALTASKRKEVAAAARAGALGAGGFALVFSAGHNAIRHRRGEVEGAKAVVDTVSATTAAAVRGGAGCAVARSIQIAARESHGLQHFASGVGPAAMGNAVVEVGVSGYRFATGQIDAAQFAEQCGTAVLQNSAAWAYGVVGQTLIPVPILGGLVGATVGYVSAAVIKEGLKLAYIAAREADAAEADLARLESWIYDAIQRLEENRLVVETINDIHAAHFRDTVVPMMDELESCLGSIHDCLGQLDALCREFDASLPFATFEEFEEFMADEATSLEL